MASILIHSRRPLAVSSLLLLYWFVRLHAIGRFAFFIDEANHVWWAQLAWENFPFHAASDGRLLNVLWIAAFWPFNAAVWLSRVSVVLITTAGLAALFDASRRCFSFRAAIIAGLLYTFMPLTFFFERLALADSISAPFVAGAVRAVARARRDAHWRWPLLGGESAVILYRLAPNSP